MRRDSGPMQKITISLPTDLVDFADEKARLTGTSRSQVISECLASVHKTAEESLAAEGYRYLAEEAREFAETSAGATAEAWCDER